MNATDHHKLELASRAVTWLLRRMAADPRLAYLIGFGSESFDRLAAAGAALVGEELDVFRERHLLSLATQPVPPIGQAGAVVEQELFARMAAYDGGVHDLDNQDDVNMLVNHFVRRGLEVAEAERDKQSGSLF